LRAVIAITSLVCLDPDALLLRSPVSSLMYPTIVPCEGVVFCPAKSLIRLLIPRGAVLRVERRGRGAASRSVSFIHARAS
jgi:hypothetical protein